MLTPEQAAMEIRAFAKDETGIGNVKSAWAALDVIEQYMRVGAKPASEDGIFGTLFWQHLNLLWKQSFVPMSLINRWRVARYTRALEAMLHRWPTEHREAMNKPKKGKLFEELEQLRGIRMQYGVGTETMSSLYKAKLMEEYRKKHE
jgi:hypothetical protein